MKTFHFIKIDRDIVLVSRSITKTNLNIPDFFIKEVFCKEEEIFKNNQLTKLFDQKEVEKVIETNEEVFVYDPSISPYFEEGKVYLERKKHSTFANKNDFYRNKFAEYIKYINDDIFYKMIEAFR